MGCNYNWKSSSKTSMMLFQNIKTSLMFWGEFKTPQNHFLLLCATMC
ncbi:hypothetical protein AB205_0018760 [Aquarana catesbeiana]|uniref:Uncharacterized protein n=1 Tax=Aquarana catesbeiana TaxID=8400 RepID=A0A2G9Q0J3_AQUCT|nr:hypothetical protein AB205_0018760 [Aquarana catesbeiana]